MSEPQASSDPLAQSADRAAADVAPAQTDVAADMALVLAALGRLETAVRDGREVLARLRACLADMASAIVKAKAMADTPAAMSLLNEFEHRIDVMLEIAGGDANRIAPATEAATAASEQDEAAAEPTEVPTVSGVVSRLGAGHGDTPSTAADTPKASDRGLVDASNVAMLTAMVQALRDSMPSDAPETATAPETSAAPENAGAPEAAAEPETASPQPIEATSPAPQEAGAPPPDHATTAAVSAEPKPEPDPASASEPETPLQARRLNMAASLPPPEFVSIPVHAVAEPPQDAPPADNSAVQPTQPAHDPLRALKAMSENERLALFS